MSKIPDNEIKDRDRPVDPTIGEWIRLRILSFRHLQGAVAKRLAGGDRKAGVELGVQLNQQLTDVLWKNVGIHNIKRLRARCQPMTHVDVARIDDPLCRDFRQLQIILRDNARLVAPALLAVLREDPRTRGAADATHMEYEFGQVQESERLLTVVQTVWEQSVWEADALDKVLARENLVRHTQLAIERLVSLTTEIAERKKSASPEELRASHNLLMALGNLFIAWHWSLEMEGQYNMAPLLPAPLQFGDVATSSSPESVIHPLAVLPQLQMHPKPGPKPGPPKGNRT